MAAVSDSQRPQGLIGSWAQCAGADFITGKAGSPLSVGPSQPARTARVVDKGRGRRLRRGRPLGTPGRAVDGRRRGQESLAGGGQRGVAFAMTTGGEERCSHGRVGVERTVQTYLVKCGRRVLGWCWGRKRPRGLILADIEMGFVFRLLGGWCWREKGETRSRPDWFWRQSWK